MEPDDLEAQDHTQDQSGFDDGFSDTPTTTPLATPPADETTETAAPAAPTPAPAPKLKTITEDEWNDLTARAALIDEIRATQASGLDKAFGKIGGIERTLSELRSGTKVDISDDEIEAVEEDWPAVANLLRKVRAAGSTDAPALDEDALGQLVEKRLAPVMQSLPQQVEQVVEMRLLSRVHPDWKDQTNSAEWQQYVGALPAAEARKLYDAWDADYIAGHLTTFKKARKATASRRQELAEAATPRGVGGAAPGSSIEDEFNAGFK